MNKNILIFLLLNTLLISHPIVDSLDISRFMGRWYVIALIPNWIEEGCSNSYDDYKLNKDGTIDITYSAIKNGKTRTIKQKAVIPDKNKLGKWEIQFMKPWIPFFRAPYELILLDDSYDYMVVGYPDNSFGWIMSRKTVMDDEIYSKILNKLEIDFNYDKNKFEKVIHDKK